MNDLNFLPEKDQKAIALHALGIVFRHTLIWLVFVVVILATVIAWGKFFLERSLATWQEQTILVTQQRESVSERVIMLNALTKSVLGIQEEYNEWSRFLADIAALVPSGSRIEYLFIQRDTGSVNIQGLSNTRDALLSFQNNLEASDLFSSVRSPLSNLLNPRDIVFEFTATLADTTIHPDN